MTEQEVIDATEQHADDLQALMTADENTDVSGYKSIRKIVKEYINTLSRKWSDIRYYVSGDIISYNDDVFISRKHNLNQNPEIEDESWHKVSEDIIPGTVGFDVIFNIKRDIIENDNGDINNVVRDYGGFETKYSVYFNKSMGNDKYIIIASPHHKDFTYDYGIRNQTHYGFDLYCKVDTVPTGGTTINSGEEPEFVSIAIKRTA